MILLLIILVYIEWNANRSLGCRPTRYSNQYIKGQIKLSKEIQENSYKFSKLCSEFNTYEAVCTQYMKEYETCRALNGRNSKKCFNIMRKLYKYYYSYSYGRYGDEDLTPKQICFTAKVRKFMYHRYSPYELSKNILINHLYEYLVYNVSISDLLFESIAKPQYVVDKRSKNNKYYKKELSLCQR